MTELTTTLLYKYRNKNVGKQGSENSQTADFTDLRYLIEKWKDNAQWYEQRLIEYLCQEVATFPKYTQAPNYSDIVSKTDAYSCSIFLGNTNDEERRKEIRKYL